MPIISSSPSPPLPPPCSAPHCSAPPHPVIPQERREEKHMKKEWKRETGEQKDLRKSRAELEGVGVVHKREPVFGFLHRIDLFICFICVCVCVCPCPFRRVHQRSVQSAPTSAWAPATTSVVKERHLAVAAALWAHFFPFLRSLRLSQTPPAQLADAAAGQLRPQEWTRHWIEGRKGWRRTGRGSAVQSFGQEFNQNGSEMADDYFELMPSFYMKAEHLNGSLEEH